MKAFLIGLQFLTRIHLVKQTVWTEEDFGKSVRYFPLVGLVLGLVYLAGAIVVAVLPEYLGWQFPEHLRAAILVILPILATGGIHCDGFMDTVDGIFSGRDRERMLEIMKDSCSGSFGVAAFGILLLLQYSVVLDMDTDTMLEALLVMPIIGRLMMTMVICLCPYARPEGIGKAFAKYAGRKTCSLVVLYTSALLIILCDWQAVLAMMAAMVFTYFFANYVVKKLGGVTGDVYGAVCILAELVVLICYLLLAMVQLGSGDLAW